MRVTQSMLSNNMLRNLSNSYSKMGKLQEQITSGKKFVRLSDDPVSAVRGMSYRTDLNKAEQFTRNMQTVNTWLDTTDDALDQVGSALHRIKELVVQAANDTNTPDDREKIKAEIDQIRNQLRNLANTKVSNKYIFSGTNTLSPIFDTDGNINNVNEESVEIEVFDGITLNVNIAGKTLFTNIDDFMGELSNLLDDENTLGENISEKLGDLDRLYEEVLTARADVGARQNRVELMANRISSHSINITKRLSENEDVDYAKAITEMVTAESIHQAALSVGAKIIQQTLVDFIR
ncbi:flagellar hook-associated protein FlgL [Ureibacillus thermosphaericus]|uniref:Flagellar hook-associated protein 3 FlgL n=1 Tax=Ureibacillus thermosphaericus TaxID=51173 RepID=A0A840PV15_URETH|nr:flagellar hook-associated protein FlgL [Ureibacillus thermosphaericus]MBB5149720.1 flagellar hook-associated protein 3 FlgL [Ureibacillus thermosphaericus]NKZ32646.1 flagellar hook-associated protein FlgL [Ureibacillus thermosphaericus]